MQKYGLSITAIFIMLYVISCSKTDDTKPFFDVIAPASGETYQTGDSINFQAIFYDNEALGQYRIEVKSNFGEQTACQGVSAVCSPKLLFTSILYWPNASLS